MRHESQCMVGELITRSSLCHSAESIHIHFTPGGYGRSCPHMRGTNLQ